MPPGDSERYGTRHTILEDCRYPSYLSIRTQFSCPNEAHLINERTINPAQHQHFWELSHSTTVILYKNDRSFWRYATAVLSEGAFNSGMPRPCSFESWSETLSPNRLSQQSYP